MSYKVTKTKVNFVRSGVFAHKFCKLYTLYVKINPVQYTGTDAQSMYIIIIKLLCQMRSQTYHKQRKNTVESCQLRENKKGLSYWVLAYMLREKKMSWTEVKKRLELPVAGTSSYRGFEVLGYFSSTNIYVCKKLFITCK